MIRHALFDWDGTLSLLRAGWAEVMTRQWLAVLPSRSGELMPDRERFAQQEIWALNGKPTIHQMARLVELVTERGGLAHSAGEYNQDFQARLAAMVDGRIEQIKRGRSQPDEFMVAGARAFLDALVERGLTLHLASGTEFRFIAAEAKLLNLYQYFGPRFHGPSGPDDRQFSKRSVIDRILADHQVAGEALVAFGDGHVEIEQTKAVGGFAIAVCSDEGNWRSGQLDPAKLIRLGQAGADFCTPDFLDAAPLLDRILRAPSRRG